MIGKADWFVVVGMLGAVAVFAAAEPGWRLNVTGELRTFEYAADGTGEREVARAEKPAGPKDSQRWERSPDRTRIVFVRYEERGGGRDDEIFVADADGANERRLTDNTAEDQYATWSPDGKRIAFVRYQRGTVQRVWVMDADGQNAAPLGGGAEADRESHMPKFGPDGRLAYLAPVGPLGKGRHSDLMVGDGKTPARALARTYVSDFAWSPDGKWIVYGKIGSLVFHELASGKEREVSFAGLDERARSHAAAGFVWRPDSGAVACRVHFLGGRQAGGPKMFGDDELFVFPKDEGPKPTWFVPREKPERWEWAREHQK